MKKNDIAIRHYFGNEHAAVDPRESAYRSEVAPAKVSKKAAGWYTTRLGETLYTLVKEADTSWWRVRHASKTGREVKHDVYGFREARKLVTWLALWRGDIEDDAEAR